METKPEDITAINGTVLRRKREPSPLNALSKGINALLSQDAPAKDEPAKFASTKATNGESSQDEKHDAEVLGKAANNETSELEVSLKAANETNSEINTKPPKAGNDLTLDAQVSPKIKNDVVLNEEISPRTTTNKAKVEATADDGFFHQPIDSDENLSVELEEALRLEEEKKELKEKGVVEKQGGEEIYVDEELLKASKVETANKEMKQNEVVAKSGSEDNAEVYVDESLLKASEVEAANKEIKQNEVIAKSGSEDNAEVYVDESLLKASEVVAANKEMKQNEVVAKSGSEDNAEVYVDESLLKASEVEAANKEIKQNEVVAKSGSEANADVYVDESLLKAASNTDAIADDKQDGVGGKPDSEKNTGINDDKTLMKEQRTAKAETDDGFFHQPIDSDENFSIEREEAMRLKEEEKEIKQEEVGEKHDGEEVYVDEALLKAASKGESATDDGFFHQPIDSDENLSIELEEIIRLEEEEKENKRKGVGEKLGGEEVYVEEALLKAASNTEAVADNKQDEKPGIEVNVSKPLMKARSNINAIEHDGFFHEPFDSDENLTFELEEAIRLEEEAEEMKRNGVGEESDSENDDDAEEYDDKLLLKRISKLKVNPIDSDENLSIDFEKERSNFLEGKEISQNSLGRNPPNSQRRFLDENNHKVVPKNIIIIPETNADVINLSIFNKPPNQAFMDQLKADMAMQNSGSFPKVKHHKYQATKSFKSGDSLNFHIPDFVTLKKLLHNSEIYLKTEKGINYDVPCTIKEGNLFVCKPKSASVGKASKRHGNFKEHSQNPKKQSQKHNEYNRQDSMIKNKSDSHKHANGRKAFPVVLQNNGYQHEPWMKSKY